MEQKDIIPEDLIYLEGDLTCEELISVLFLLYGSEKPDWILQKIKNQDKNLLYDYATHHSNWKTAIVEALSIAGIYELVDSLGIKISEAKEHLRSKPITNFGLRVLFLLCEACSATSTDKLITHIKNHCDDAKKSKEGPLEVFLLHSIANKLIKVTSTLENCDFSFLTNFFEKNKIDEIAAVLAQFPKKSSSRDNGSSTSFNAIKLATPTSPKSLTDVYRTKKLQVLIINQQHFVRETNPEVVHLLPEENLNERNGTVKDKEALQLLFENFGYPVTAKSNLIHSEILQEISKVTKKASICDGVIVCILSHGHEGIVYGHNSIPVRVKDIKSIMASSSLVGKTKILLIQACQGESLQKSVKKIVSKLETDGPRQSTVTSGSVYADFLIFWSTIEGFASVRHVDNGSWFIQEFVKKTREMHKTHHLMDICTAVVKEVSLKRGYRDECMVSKHESTFTRSFFFPEIADSSNC